MLDLSLPDRLAHGLDTKTVSVLASCTNIETHLALAAGAKSEDLLAMARLSQEIPATGMIFTKLDLTRTLGGVFETVRKSRIPISFFSVGRSIPEDLIEARAEDLTEWITDEWQETS